MKVIKFKNLILLPIIVLTISCSNKDSSVDSKDEIDDIVIPTFEDEPINYSFPENASFKQKLEMLDGVIKVEDFNLSSTAFAGKYMVTFEQPLDWNNKEAGTFPQRVEVQYKEDNALTVYQCNGYYLNDYYSESYLRMDDRNELAKYYDSNFVNIEYRYFYKSRTETLDESSVEEWKYLTVENAARDFHHIIRHLSVVLPGKRIFAGASKGGYTTNVQAMYFPNDADAFVSYVNCFCNDLDDTRFMKNIYETIGVSKYGEERAANYRKLITNFQIELLKNRDSLAERLYQKALSNGCKFRAYVTKDNLFDLGVLDLATGVWQYNHDFMSVANIMKMEKVDNPNTSVDEKQKFLDACFKYLLDNELAESWDYSSVYMPYYYQSITEMGNYKMDFSYLRNELTRLNLSQDLITVKESDEAGIWKKMLFTPEQNASFAYSNDTYKMMLKWARVNTANVAMINGQTDTWYAVRFPADNNERFKVFDLPNEPHGAQMSKMSKDMKEEFLNTINTWLNQ